MKAILILVLLIIAVLVYGQGSKTPINNGILQSDLNAAGYKITNANLVDYAGTGLSWNVVTGKFDATGGGGGGGAPGGSNQQFQYNNSGSLGGISSMTYNGTVPITITKTPGANTRSTGIILQNTTTGASDQYAPSIHFIQNVSAASSPIWGAGVYDTMLTAEQGWFLIGSQRNGDGFGHVMLALDLNGNLGSGYGDARCSYATFQAYDQVIFGNNSYAANIATAGWNGGGFVQMAGFPTDGTVPRIAWSSGTRYDNGTNDTSIGRAAAGEVGIYSGIASTLGALRTATQSPGDNSTKAATTAFVTAAVAAGGGGGGTPGGSNTQVQYNNSGAFGGISGATTNGTAMTLKGPIVADNDSINYLTLSNTSGTSFTNQIQWQSAAGFNRWAMGNDSSRGGSLDFYLYDYSSASKLYINGNQFNIPAASILGWGTTASVDITGVDTGLARNAAGVLEVNNGTAGTLRDLKARNVTATALANLTTNGFVKTSGAVGTLSVDTATYQPSDADLTTWAGITPVAAVGTWIATPSSANLRLAVTDENGTGALLFSGATTPDFTTGFTIGAAAASGKILVGNGTNFVPSTPTYPNAASPTARKFIVSDGTNWTASTETQAVPGTSGNVLTSDGTNWTSAAPVVTASNTLTFTNKRITKRSLALAAPTPAPSINADSYDVVHITGLTAAITSVTMTGTPVEGDTLRMDFTDNGTARAIALGGSFEAGAAPLPTTTVISTRLDTVFYWNTVTSKWRCQASSASPTYPATAGAVGYTIRSDATNFASYPAQLVNSSVASQSPSTSDVYLTGSNIVVTAGDMKAKGQYKCVFDMTKSAGTGAIVITLRVGTAGTTSDAAIQTYTFGAGTSVADFGLFEVIATWRTVGSGTSAVMQGMCRGTHQLATTGLFNNAAGWMVLGSPSPSSGFNSSTATNIGISFNGSTAFAGTTQIVQAQLQQ